MMSFKEIAERNMLALIEENCSVIRAVKGGMISIPSQELTRLEMSTIELERLLQAQPNG